MNQTLGKFQYPEMLVKEYKHWVVLIRPIQTTPLCCVIAATSEVESFGDLSARECGELPIAISDYESTVRRIVPATKFNYLALMMVDPNPHFHAIPRYAKPVTINHTDYPDSCYPGPPDILKGHNINNNILIAWRDLLVTHWTTQY